MSDPEPVRRHQLRSLRDRVAAMFIPPSPSPLSQSPSTIDGERSFLPREEIHFANQGDANARTRLIESYHNREAACGSRHCNHGTFSPNPVSHHNRSMSPIEGCEESRYLGKAHDHSSVIHGVGDHDDISPATLEHEASMSATKKLARTHRVKNQRTMYVGPVCSI